MFPWQLVVAIVLGVAAVVALKKKVAPGAAWQAVPGYLQALVWVAILINPVIGGLIIYYSLRTQFPLIARRANKISFIAFALWAPGLLVYVFFINPSVLL